MAKDNGAAPRADGQYIVLEKQTLPAPDGSDKGIEAWVQVGDKPFPARTGDEAKRMAASSIDLTHGDKLTLVAIPAKSFRATTAEVVIPEPKLVLS